jgi:hypothetical protein
MTESATTTVNEFLIAAKKVLLRDGWCQSTYVDQKSPQATLFRAGDKFFKVCLHYIA